MNWSTVALGPSWIAAIALSCLMLALALRKLLFA